MFLCPCSPKGDSCWWKRHPKDMGCVSGQACHREKWEELCILEAVPRRAFYRWFSQTQQQQEEIKVTPPLKRPFPSVLSFICRNQFYPSQHQAPEPDLPCGLEDGFFQLQPRGPVECWLPDWWVFLGAWSCPCQGHHDLALEGFS